MVIQKYKEASFLWIYFFNYLFIYLCSVACKGTDVEVDTQLWDNGRRKYGETFSKNKENEHFNMLVLRRNMKTFI